MDHIDIDDLKRWSYAQGATLINALKQSNWVPSNDSHAPISAFLGSIVLQDDGRSPEDKKIVLECIVDKWASLFLATVDPWLHQTKRKDGAKQCRDFKDNWRDILFHDFNREWEVFVSLSWSVTPAAPSRKLK